MAFMAFSDYQTKTVARVSPWDSSVFKSEQSHMLAKFSKHEYLHFFCLLPAIRVRWLFPYGFELWIGGAGRSVSHSSVVSFGQQGAYQTFAEAEGETGGGLSLQNEAGGDRSPLFGRSSLASTILLLFTDSVLLWGEAKYKQFWGNIALRSIW